MPLFACERCGGVDNTAMGHYWMRGDGPALCTLCDPRIRKWHDAFPRRDATAAGYVVGPDGFLRKPESMGRFNPWAQVQAVERPRPERPVLERPAPATPRRRAHSPGAARRKGQELQRTAKGLLQALGCWVEIAPASVRWVPKVEGGVRQVDPVTGKPQLRPMSAREDFFGIFDLVAVHPDGRRFFAQVTVLEGVGARRVKMQAARFPATREDLLMAHVRGAEFKVMRGPAWIDRDAERWVWKRPRKAEVDQAQARGAAPPLGQVYVDAWR